MKIKILFVLWLIGSSPRVFSIFYFHNIPSAKTIHDSLFFFEERRDQLIKYYAKKKLGETFDLKNHRGFSQPAVARAYYGIDGSEVSRIILEDNFKPFGKVGTNFKFIPRICERRGDYDFALIHLIQLAFISKNKNYLSEKAYEKLILKMLTAKGNKHHTSFRLGLCGKFKDTENHILMTETSRYLTNDLLKDFYKKKQKPLADVYDNSANGFDDWLIKHLQDLKINSFDEYNSKPYQSYAIIPIANLAAFAKNKKIKKIARELLDHQSRIFNIQSYKGIRLPPFRRQLFYEQQNEILSGDGEISRHALLVGEIDFYPGGGKFRIVNYGAHVMFSLAVTGVKINEDTLKEIFQRDKDQYIFFKHQTPEIYHRSKSYTLSAGGVHVNRLDGGTKLNDGWAMPTTLLTKYNPNPTKESFFRFKGNRHRLKRRNTCVYKNFACGLNFSFPNNFDRNCGIKKGEYIFFDLSSSKCGKHADLFMALKIFNCHTFKCRRVANNFGFFEVRESTNLNFNSFIETVLKNNKKRDISYNKKNQYITSKNEQISFIPNPKRKNQWEIISVNKQNVVRDFNYWPAGLFELSQLFTK